MTQTAGAGRHFARRGQHQPAAVPGLPPDDEDEDSLDAYVKEVVDALPPLVNTASSATCSR